jgi:hypothetical protein
LAMRTPAPVPAIVRANSAPSMDFRIQISQIVVAVRRRH